jgi:hypothetical protein
MHVIHTIASCNLPARSQHMFVPLEQWNEASRCRSESTRPHVHQHECVDIQEENYCRI